MKRSASVVFILSLIFCLAGLIRANQYDLYSDSRIDLKDLYVFTGQWLSQDCAANSWCDGVDFDESNSVDLVDFSLFAQNWDKPISLSTEYYIATDGNDNDAGTLVRPWKTVEKALDYIGAASGLPSGGITIWIRGGTYYVDETIVLEADHSGTSSDPITLKAYTGEEPIFIGGKEVTGWVLDSGSVYKAAVDCNSWRFDQLFENGVRQTKARMPNTGYLRTDAPDSGDVKRAGFKFKSGELPTWSPSDYADAQVNIWAYANWFESILPIQAINYTTRKVTYTKLSVGGNQTEDRYFIQGIKSLLDVPGEFFLDEPNGYLYYWPTLTPIAEQIIVAPTVENVFEFRGTDGSTPTEYINLEGITIWCSKFTHAFADKGWDEGAYTTSNRPAEINRRGLVRMENASNITIRNCKLYNAGFCGVAMDYYSSYNTVAGCEIFDCGYHGVLLIGKDQGAGVTTSSSQQIYDNKFNTVYNNHIYRPGRLAGEGAGVFLYQSGDNLISHNHIHNSDRYGICLKGRGSLIGPFGSFGSVAITTSNFFDFYTCNNNTISYNNVHDCLEDSYDAGAISFKMPGRYNVIDNNRIHDVSPNPSMDKDYAFGIYLDGGTENTTVTNNVIHDIHSTKVSGTYPINIKKLNHTVSNNIFIAESGGAPRGTIMIQQGGGGELDSTGYGGHVLTNNILFARGLQANAWFYRFHESEFDCSLVHTSDYNIFYKSVTGPKVFYGITGDDNYTQWKTICSSKYDDHSNDSDPLFRGPGSDNYNLEPGSPAYARGFVEIDQNLPGLDDANYIIVDNFAATLDSVNGQIEMDWDAVSGASGYKVKRSTTSGASYGTIATPGSSSYTDTPPISGTKYYYKVCAVIDGNDAPNSKEVGVFFVTQGPIVFSDGFESGDFSNWTSNASWDISSIQKKNGSYSGRADADSGTLSKSIDTSSYSTMTISFWYRDHLVDDGDQAFFRLYDGANYDSIFEVGITSPEDTWHYYTRTMTNSGPDAQYFHAGFRFRWTCGFVDADEYIWIDDVVLRAQ